MTMHAEYLRRNMAVAKAEGAHGISVQAIARLAAIKRPPLWLAAALAAIRDRTQGLGGELAAWRNQADDAPKYVRSMPPSMRIAQLEAVILEAARRAEALKRECGMDPESPTAIQNSRYMSLSAFLRAALPA